jgi:hypothetical protein
MHKEVIGLATLYLGDCREIAPGLERPAAVITDPPYGIALSDNSKGGRHGRPRPSWENHIAGDENQSLGVFIVEWCEANELPDFGRLPGHVWFGVSVEDAKVKRRIDVLRTIPASVRFLSVEPLIGPLGALDLSGIHWVIVGGESGLGARPMHPDWVREIRDQCIAQNVPFFFKQWGGIRPKSNGRELDGREWNEMPVEYAK